MEIERKFLVNKKFNMSILENELCINIVQGFLTNRTDPLIRVRLENKNAFITVKKNINLISREEFEKRIPYNKGVELLKKCVNNKIKKTRYIYNFEKTIWEIDVFKGHLNGLIIAEVELNHEEQKIQIPEWIGKEVTGDERYYNVNLALIGNKNA